MEKTTCKCKLCGHEWTPRSTRPPMCPNCHARKWYGDARPDLGVRIYKHRCKRCNYKWESSNEHPGNCSRCGTVLWDKPRVYRMKEESKARKHDERN